MAVKTAIPVSDGNEMLSGNWEKTRQGQCALSPTKALGRPFKMGRPLWSYKKIPASTEPGIRPDRAVLSDNRLIKAKRFPEIFTRSPDGFFIKLKNDK